MLAFSSSSAAAVKARISAESLEALAAFLKFPAAVPRPYLGPPILASLALTSFMTSGGSCLSAMAASTCITAVVMTTSRSFRFLPRRGAEWLRWGGDLLGPCRLPRAAAVWLLVGSLAAGGAVVLVAGACARGAGCAAALLLVGPLGGRGAGALAAGACARGSGCVAALLLLVGPLGGRGAGALAAGACARGTGCAAAMLLVGPLAARGAGALAAGACARGAGCAAALLLVGP